MRYYIIAGEASGDLHASNLMRALRERDPDAAFRCWGGDLMEEQGGVLVKHYRDLAFMGFAEVVMNLSTILRNIRFCKKDLLANKPDVLILVDYPGFNLRIAAFAKSNGIKVVYYISPQAWAWKESRVHKIKQVVDRMMVILPFEEAFYQKHAYKAYFVGHPLLDAIGSQTQIQADRSAFCSENGLDNRPIIALLPGSRYQEIKTKLPLMLTMTARFPDYQFVVAAAPSQELSFYRALIGTNQVSLLKGKTYDLFRHAHAALVTSGTATLEAALFKVPEVVCYKANRFSYLIARMLVKIRFISLVNLIMDREVVRELIQHELNPDNLEIELAKLLQGPARQQMLQDYEELSTKLGGPGASRKAAAVVMDFLSADVKP